MQPLNGILQAVWSGRFIRPDRRGPPPAADGAQTRFRPLPLVFPLHTMV